jgi:hypothetical protein
MATAEYKATMDASGGARASSANLVGVTVSDATAADTAVGTVVTDNTATLAAIDAFAAAIIAITGDTYVAHQFVFGGATGLTHAQVATNFALLNTAITDFLAGQTATTAAKVATALVVTDAAAVDSGADVTVRIGSLANVGTRTKFRAALDAIYNVVLGSNIMTA